MKLFLIVLLAATSAFARAPASITPASIVKAACGPEDVHYDVVLDKAKHELSQPEPGKALVYFVQDIGTRNPFGAGTAQVTVVGMDGAWVGANQNESWFAVSVEPGADLFLQDARLYVAEPPAAIWAGGQPKYMIASYPMAVSNARK